MEEILETDDGGKRRREKGGQEKKGNRKIPEPQSAWQRKASFKIRLAQICS